MNAKNVVIVPGYGLAVANAQYAISELVKILRARGVHVRFAIHPVAGEFLGNIAAPRPQLLSVASEGRSGIIINKSVISRWSTPLPHRPHARPVERAPGRGWNPLRDRPGDGPYHRAGSDRRCPFCPTAVWPSNAG